MARPDIAPRSKQQGHGHKTQPKPSLQQRPRIAHHHQPSHHTPVVKPRPALVMPSQQAEQNQHEHGALRWHAPACKHRIQQGRHTSRRIGNINRWATQCPWVVRLPSIAASPHKAHADRYDPRQAGDVQTRNRHQMRHTGGSQYLPIAAINGRLVAQGQG